MIENLKDYTENALAISDEQVADDWTLGLVHGVARYIAEVALPVDSINGWGDTKPGSDREHIEGYLDQATNSRTPRCKLLEIFNISEVEGTEFYEKTYGPGEVKNVLVVSAEASCACGRIVLSKVILKVPAAEYMNEMLWTNSTFYPEPEIVDELLTEFEEE